jgi:transcription initiation factor IIE alpha subunit
VSPDWPLMRRILALLAEDDGLADAEIAERLSMPLADVQQAARILYRQRRTDFCQGFIVLAPRAGGGRRAA